MWLSTLWYSLYNGYGYDIPQLNPSQSLKHVISHASYNLQEYVYFTSMVARVWNQDSENFNRLFLWIYFIGFIPFCLICFENGSDVTTYYCSSKVSIVDIDKQW